MKEYFIDKLTKTKRDLESTGKSIIRGIDEYKAEELVNLSKRYKELNARWRELTKDCVVYCSVSEVLEISNQTDYSREQLNLLEKSELPCAYKYIEKPISLQERELLVQRFGYELKSAKV